MLVTVSVVQKMGLASALGAGGSSWVLPLQVTSAAKASHHRPVKEGPEGTKK